MSDSLLDKYKRPAVGDHAAKVSPKVVPIHEEEPEPDDLGCFGYLRGTRERALALELCKRNGHVFAVPYSFISRFEYMPEESMVTIWLPDRPVRIRGLKLNTRINNVRLFEALLKARVTWLLEASEHQVLAAGNERAVIQSIEWDVE